MANVLTTGEAYLSQNGELLAIGRTRIPFQVTDSDAIAPSWATVLAVGNTSGPTDPTISSGQKLLFAGTGLIDATSSLGFAIGSNPRMTMGFSQLNLSLNAIAWGSAVLAPSITQADASSGAGQTMTMRSQSGPTGGGGFAVRGGNALTAGNGGPVTIKGGTPAGGGTRGIAAILLGNDELGVAVYDSEVTIGDDLASTRISVTTSGIAFNGGTHASAPAVTGSRGGNAALASLLATLDSMGLITDATTA